MSTIKLQYTSGLGTETERERERESKIASRFYSAVYNRSIYERRLWRRFLYLQKVEFPIAQTFGLTTGADK